MTTTLNGIKSVFLSHPHSLTPWGRLLKSLNKMEADDEPLDLMHVLETVGIKCSIWCLASFSYKDYCLFLADVAESVQPNSNATATLSLLQAIRDYHKGVITLERLLDESTEMLESFRDSGFVSEAFYAAHSATVSPRLTAYYSVTAARQFCHSSIVSDAESKKWSDIVSDAESEKWEEIRQLFMKHFSN